MNSALGLTGQANMFCQIGAEEKLSKKIPGSKMASLKVQAQKVLKNRRVVISCSI